MKQAAMGLGGTTGGDRHAGPTGGGVSSFVDRTSYQQYRAEQARVLPCRGNYLELLDAAHRHCQALLDREFAEALEGRLSSSGAALVNECLQEIVTVLRECIVRAKEPWGASKNRLLATLFESPACMSDSVSQVMARDPFHGVLPYFDGPAMLMLSGPNLDPRFVDELKQTLYHRFLHGPQRTRHLFFHEMAVGYFLNLLENRGVIPSRREVKVQMSSYPVIPAVFMRALAEHLGRSTDALALLHFGDNDELDRSLPPPIRDLMTACAHLYFCCELAVVYEWKSRNGGIIEHVVKFFAIPVLERMSKQQLRLRPKAGTLVERLLIDVLYGQPTRGANEVDLVIALAHLADAMWVEVSPRRVPLAKTGPALEAR